MEPVNPQPLFSARARVLADLEARGCADPAGVSALEDAVADREWWADQWPQGEKYVAGLIAQDVQDRLFDAGVRWPVCDVCPVLEEHSLHVQPDLGGPDPRWVCEHSGQEVAPLGRLPTAAGRTG